MSKRLLTALVAPLLLLSASMVFAGGQDEAAAAEGPVTLTVWDFKYGEVEGMQPPMMKIDEMFMEAFPNITVDHVAQPHNEYYQVLRATVTAGSGPDVVMFHGGANAWEFDEFLEPLDPYIESWRHEIPEYSWNAASYMGDPDEPVKLVPITTQGMGWYYNKLNFEKAGLDPDNPPKTREEFLDACQALKDAGIPPIVTGMTPNNTFVAWGLRNLTVNAYPNEDVLEWQTADVDFSDPGFEQAVMFIDELHQRGFIDSAAYDMPLFMEALNKFSAGEGGFFLGLLSDIAHWKNFADGFGKGNVGYFPTVNLPGQPAGDMQYLQGAGIGYAMMTWTNKKDQAAEYLKYYGSDGASVLVDMVGALHPNQAVDLSAIGYPSLDVIMGYVADSATQAFNQYIPTAAHEAAISTLSQSWLISGDLTAEEWIEQSNEILAQERANQ
jgi:ABC-type glycerol-3-phosphate transport system substrate-binding protein